MLLIGWGQKFHQHRYAGLLTDTEYIYIYIVLSITFYFHYNIWGCMCSTGPFQYRWLKGLSIARATIIIKSEVSTFPIVIIFFRGCVPEMFVTSCSVTYCIYTFRENYDECKCSDTFWLADRTHLFVQYTISLSSLCKFIWRHWTYEMPVRYILSSVWVRWSIFSQLSIIP